MDTIDTQLVTLLQADGRESCASLARRLRLAESAVRRRVQRLLQERVIRIVAIPDHAKQGIDCCALIGLDVDLAEVDRAMEALAKDDRVYFTVATTGRYDVFIGVDCGSLEEMSAFISEVVSVIKGIRQSETFIYLKVLKSHHRLDRWRPDQRTAKAAHVLSKASSYRNEAA